MYSIPPIVPQLISPPTTAFGLPNPIQERLQFPPPPSTRSRVHSRFPLQLRESFHLYTVGRACVRRGDRVAAVNVLRQMGIEAEVRVLEHANASRYVSPEAALESLRRVVAPADEREERALERYVAEHVVVTTGADGGPAWKQEPAITVRWAFLAWDKPLGDGRP